MVYWVKLFSNSLKDSRENNFGFSSNRKLEKGKFEKALFVPDGAPVRSADKIANCIWDESHNQDKVTIITTVSDNVIRGKCDSIME